MEKLCKMARRIDLGMKALQILVVTLSVLIASLYVFNVLAGDDFGVWSFHLVGMYSALNPALGWLLFFAMAATVLYGLHIVRRILQPMKRGEPFATSVSADMRRLGFIVLIVGGALSLADAVGQAYTVERDLVLQMHRVDISFLVVSAIVFLFSYIFRYGEELQRQADETL